MKDPVPVPHVPPVCKSPLGQPGPSRHPADDTNVAGGNQPGDGNSSFLAITMEDVTWSMEDFKQWQVDVPSTIFEVDEMTDTCQLPTRHKGSKWLTP